MLIYVCTVIILMIYGVEGLTLKQSQISWTKQTGKTVVFKCEVTDLSTNNYVHWYLKKDGETFKRLLYISAATGSATKEAKEFEGQKTGNSYDLKLAEIKKEHAGVYYCAAWESNDWIKHFGAGTKLIVTVQGDDKVKEPILKAYKPSIQDDKTTMVCQASNMFPDLVKFSWQTKSSSGGDWTNVPDQDIIEQRDEVGKETPPKVFVTSMVIVDENRVKNNNYRCSVKHEGTTADKIAEIPKDKGKSSAGQEGDTLKPTCPPIEDNTEQKQKSETMDETPSLYLFLYAYGIMLMKNGLYFVAVSLYLFKRRFGKKNEST